MLLILALLLETRHSGHDLGTTRVPYTIQREHKAFRSCEDAKNYYRTLSTGEVANFRYRVADRYRIDPATKIATIEIKLVDREMYLPAWSWPGSDSTSMVAAFEQSLAAHEYGHLKIAQDFVSKLRRSITTTALTPAGRISEINRYMSDQLADLDRRQHLYDDTTRHGAAQSLASTANLNIESSANVIFYCNAPK